MAGLAPTAIISQISHPQSVREQIAALKILRNDIIGNHQRKDVWMACGVLEAVVAAATPRDPDSMDDRQRGEDAFILDAGLKSSEIVRLQALAVLGSFSSNGLDFIRAVYAASALPAILANLGPNSNPPVLVTAALRVLSALAKSTVLSIEPHPENLLVLADAVFSEEYLNSLAHILHQSSRSVQTDTQLAYTTSLISILCCHERHRDSLASAGVLDALADVLAAVVASQGLAIPPPGLQGHVEDLLRNSSVAHPEKVDIGGILQALAIIIGGSRSRANSFVCSPSLQSIWSQNFLIPVWGGSSDQPLRSKSLIDYLNPQSPSSSAQTTSPLSSAFPPLGSHDIVDSELFSAHNRAPSFLTKHSDYVELSSECSTPKSAHDTESPIIGYLIWMTRSSEPAVGIMSAHLLVVLHRIGMAAQHREEDIALLVVPLLVLWLDESAACEASETQPQVLATISSTVLAKLILDNERVQQAAYDAGAIPRLCSILRLSYRPVVSALDGGSWSPQEVPSTKAEVSSSKKEYSYPQQLVHQIKAREAALKAIAALIPVKEEYRKALVEQGVMGIIVDSLKPEPRKQSEKADERKQSRGTAGSTVRAVPVLGVNPVPVLAAACATIRALSRSPSILRTTLVDNGIVMPIFELLHYPDLEVQIAATAAVCNILTEMSPMRQTISEAGVLKVLCKHAHSNNVNMRYNALWALKHFVQAANNETKMSCFRELGKEWLVRLICGETDTEYETGSSSLSTGTHPDGDFDVQMRGADDEEEQNPRSYAHPESHNGFKDIDTANLGRRATRQPPIANGSSAQLLDDAKRTREDDTRVQEQALEFLRNLVAGYSTAGNQTSSEMITYLLDSFGEDSFFELMTSKLRSKVHHPFLRGHTAINCAETRVSPPRPEILSAVGWILVNIAASIPRHRQALTRQTELLRLLVQHANHPVGGVRSVICHIMLNLTWADNDQDSAAAVVRTRELERLGYLTKLDLLVKDEDLDVRERAKTARYQLLQHRSNSEAVCEI